VGNIDSDQLFPGLDDTLPKLLEDSNAVALDKALDFAYLYAEHCRSAGTAAQASKIVSSLVKKNAFSSRSSTQKSASNLSLKLMEVGTDEISSVHAVVNILLTEGLASKKPKVVQASVFLIHEAAIEFGASTLPLAPILASSPKVLSHSNATVRNSALQILAEVCRALGSKSVIQEVLDKMKKSQIAELDALLAEKPESSPARKELRRDMSTASSSTSKDAVAALQETANKLAAQRFAARPAVNLLQQLANTDYSSRIGLTKWSEKVAALTIVLECAGEMPYKLAPQSSTSNYAPLISDLKKLLGHTHFAVCTKSMEVLGMLAEGVGETLFTHLRPLVVVLLKISKDKKLTSGVNRCLDSFFGNVLGFDHLVDNDDSLLMMVDETKEKNALSRATGMEFLLRCILRNESAGPRGSLSKKSATAIASLCAEKLDDSNAAVRKASSDALKALRDCDMTEASRSANSVIESLKEKNPRAYKGLMSGDLRSGGIDRDAFRKNSESASRKAAPPVIDSCVAGTTKSAKKKSDAASSATTRQIHVKGVDALAALNIDSQSGEPALSAESSLMHASSLRIPFWDAPEDDSGVLAGLRCKLLESLVSNQPLLAIINFLHIFAQLQSGCFVRMQLSQSQRS
jgi:cytoskeleton-associated protein 5